MILFWSLATGLTIIVIAILLLRLRSVTEQETQHRLTALRDARLRELEMDIADDIIDQALRESAAREIDRAALEEAAQAAPQDAAASKILTIGSLLIIIPLVAISTYLSLGELNLISTTVESSDEIHTDQTVDEMIAALEQRLVDDPNSAEGWLLLGRAYMAVTRYDDAVVAMGKTHELVGDQVSVLLQYADALAMANGGSINSQARELIDRALSLDPDNTTALWLAGLAAAEALDQNLALNHLRRALSLSEARGEPTARLRQVIHALESTGPAPNKLDDVANTAITVEVSLAAPLIEKLNPSDALFVFARSTERQGPPLAVVRGTAKDLPATVILDHSQAMAPQFKLNPGEAITVTARVSKSGTPEAASGDLQGISPVFEVRDGDRITVVIDSVVP